MASQALADVAAALSLYFRPRIQRQINGTTVLPYLLPMVLGAGKALNYTAEFSGAADASATAEGVALDASDADAEVPVAATLPWAQYTKVASVTDLMQAAAGSNVNPGSTAALDGDSLLGQTANQAFRLGRGLAVDAYAGNPGASPIELAGAALAIDSSGIFAGINPATYTEWSATEQTGALSAISFDVLSAFLLAIYDACGEMPEFVTCPSNVFNAIRGLYRNYEAHTVEEIMLSRGGGVTGREPRVVKMASGMRAVEHDQVTFVLDRDCTANTMYAWNTRYVEIQQLDPHHSILDGGPGAIEALFRRVAQNHGVKLPQTDIEGMAAANGGFRPSIKMLGNRGMSKEAVVYAFAQMKWARRQAFGKYTFT